MNYILYIYIIKVKSQVNLSVMIIDLTNVNNPTERESFWIEKLCTYIPTGLNVREEI